MAATYRALTRKYRPQQFEDVVSQEHVSSTLMNAIKQNRLSHAYLFCGPRGVGKTTMARVLARTINQIDDTVDGESLSRTMNVVEIDAASNNKVEDVHHLREVIRVPPQSGRYKVFIIDEVHMLTKHAFNALLKTLEEPPAHAIFIFATTEPHKVLPTILSRVQRFDFKRITVGEIVSRMQAICKEEGITIDEESLHTIAKRADGALRDALGLMDQAIAFCGTNITYDELIKALNVVGNDELFEYTDVISDQDSQSGLILLDRLLKNGLDIQEFLVALTHHLRNIYVAKNNSRMYLVEATEETKKRYQQAAEKFVEADLLRLLHMVSEAQLKIRDVEQPRVHFEILLLKMVHMSRSSDLNELLSMAKELKKKSSNPLNSTRDESPDDAGEIPQKSGEITSPPAPAGSSGSAQITSNDAPDSAAKVSTGSYSTGLSSNMESTSAESQENSKQGSANGSHAKPDGQQRETVSEVSPDEDVMSVITGTPGLGFLKRAVPEEAEVEQAEVVTLGDEPLKKIKNLGDIEQEWESVLAQLEKKAPNLLYLQVKDAKLRDLKGSELEIGVNNPLAVNIVEENKELIGTICREVYGVYIRLKCIMERQKKSEKSLSPFDRFMELQRKDPALKSIVELFGAEIEYR